MTSTDHGPPVQTGDLLALLIAAACEAGAVILEAFGGALAHDLKSDASPVTASDRRAEAIIARHLAKGCPALAVVGEEAVAEGHGPSRLGRRFFLVDPLDGTKEFIAGLPDFTVNIALVENGRPSCGVVFAPAYEEIFVGSAEGAFKARRGKDGSLSPFSRIHTRVRPAQPLALASRSHRTPETDRYLEGYDLEAVIPLGSSLKFCRIAEGGADLYPCLGRTMEWDTAAGQAVLEAAGGSVLRIGGGTLRYGKPSRTEAGGFANPPFVAVGDRTPHTS